MSARTVAIVALVIAGVGSRASAQSWDAVLDVTPYPSPYLSDWETNPSLGTLTITNPTVSDQNVLLIYRVTDQGGRVVVSGRSDPVLIPSGPPTLITDFVNMPGSSQHDQGFEDQMRRTGRLPEGDQTICVAVTDPGGFVLAEDCVTFSVVYPDPPYLIGPIDDQALTSGHPVFQWTPLQVPPAFQLTYVLRISEVLDGQALEQALVANIPLFETTTFGTNFEYPIGAPPLEDGKSYVWRVQALDQNGYAASANEGRSEVWTFRLGDPGGGGPVGAAAFVTLGVANVRGDENAIPQPDSAGFVAICKNWSVTDPTHPLSSIQLGLSSPVAFPEKLSLRAQLHRYEVPGSGSRAWALVGDTEKYRLMAYGDCDSMVEDGVPWPHWLGIRTLGGAASVAWLMVGDTTRTDTSYAGDATPGLEFGAVFFAVQTHTAEAPQGFEVVRAFLEDRVVELKPGVTTYGVFQFKEGPVWEFLQLLGWGEAEVELQGFAGVAHSLSVGFGGDSRKGVAGDVSADLEFINLRAALPPRTPQLLSGLFSEGQFELVLAVTDSANLQRTAGDRVHNQYHITLMLNHTLTLSDGLRDLLRLDEGAAFVSTSGLDLSNEEFQAGTTELKLVRRYTLDATWTLGGNIKLSPPELEVGFMLAGPNKGDLMFTLTMKAGWGATDDLGKLAVTLAKSAALVRSQSGSVSDGRIANWQSILALNETLLAQATTEAEKQRIREHNDRLHKWIETEKVQQAVVRDSTVQRSIRENIAEEPHCGKLQGWYCAFRLSLGNMELADFFTLIREIGVEVRN